MTSERKACFVIAEAGVNHNGSLKLAYELVDAACAAGADAVKFQTFRSESLATLSANRASYQKKNMGGKETQREMLKKLELSFEDFATLKAHCLKKGIEFLSTPFDEESANFLINDLKLKKIKISSGDATHIPFLKMIAKSGRDILLSTGMCTLDEVRKSVEAIRQISKTVPLTLFHCTSNYPCPPEEVNLKAMLTLSEHFHLPVGYSDHTMSDEVSIAAVGLGAVAIEKHMTLDRNLSGPDHRCSLIPEEFSKMIQSVRNIEKALGDGIKKPMPAEEPIRLLVRKSLVLKKSLKAGTILTKEHLTFKRPGTGIAPEFLEQVLGQELVHDKNEDETLAWENLKN